MQYIWFEPRGVWEIADGKATTSLLLRSWTKHLAKALTWLHTQVLTQVRKPTHKYKETRGRFMLGSESLDVPRAAAITITTTTTAK